MSSTKTPKIHVALKRPRTVSGLISLAQAIEAAMASAATTFPSPTPILAQFTSDISALVTAEAAAKTRAKGAVQTRDAKLAVVVADLKQLVAYVETVANANVATAAAVINSAGMVVRKQPLHAKNDVNFRKNAASGSVVVMARVGTRAKESHDWQYSTDGGKTWLPLPSTQQAKTTITGLSPGSTVQVKTRSLSKTGYSAWTDPASAPQAARSGRHLTVPAAFGLYILSA
jgi:hypothetical protein